MFLTATRLFDGTGTAPSANPGSDYQTTASTPLGPGHRQRLTR